MLRLKAVWNRAAEISPDVFSAIGELFDELGAASVETQITRNEIKSALPTLPKRSALMHIRATLAINKGPLSAAEIEERIRTQGYVSRAQDLKRYLRRVMRKSGQFLEVSPGKWILHNAN